MDHFDHQTPTSTRCQHYVNADGTLTLQTMAGREAAEVEYTDYQIIVIRARRDGGQLIVRILTGGNPADPARQWVFASVDEVCVLVERLLEELGGPGPRSAAVPPRGGG